MQSEPKVSLSFRPIADELLARQTAETPYRLDACITQAFSHRSDQHRKLLLDAALQSNGLSFGSSEPIEVGSKLCMMLDLSESDDRLPLVGEVIFAIQKPEQPTQYWIGVEFILMSLSTEERLLRYLATQDSLACNG